MKYNIIVSVNNHNVIGENDKLIVHSKKDMRNFQKITTDSYPEGDYNILIMGYNTWKSIPADRVPLKNRMNIVLTRNHVITESDNVKSFKELHDAFQWSQENETGKVFVIGGSHIFNECCKGEYLSNLDQIYLTRFDNNYHPRNSTQSFPIKLFQDMILVHQSDKMNEICERPHLEKPKSFLAEYLAEQASKSVSFTFDTFQKAENVNHDEIQYLDLLNKICSEGVETQSRNSLVYSLFGERMIYDLQKGFPLLTTKTVGYKTILRELLWFIRGQTSNKELNDKNVRIWDQNSTREFLDSRGLDYEEGDLGPVYGFQWRHSGAEYETCETDYSGKGKDQLKEVIQLIKEDPGSRRIIMSAWNANDIDKMALPPCHVMCQFHVNQKEGQLDCQLYQRSGDMFLGVPFNIASYAFLTHIICKLTGYKAGRLIHVLGDAHIYESHMNAVKEQIKRVPYEFPELIVSDDLTDIDDIKEEYFTMNNYKSWPKITAPMIA